KDLLHRGERRKPARLRLGGAEAVDHAAAHVVDGEKRADRGTGHGERLEDERRVEPGEARAAVRLANIDAAETELGDLRPERLRDRALPLPVAREGRDVFLPEGMG